MTRWVVVTHDAYETWEATTDPIADAELRIAVLEWVLALGDGPPAAGVYDELRATWFAPVGATNITIEYLVLSDLDPPAIVVREYW